MVTLAELFKKAGRPVPPVLARHEAARAAARGGVGAAAARAAARGGVGAAAARAAAREE